MTSSTFLPLARSFKNRSGSYGDSAASAPPRNRVRQWFTAAWRRRAGQRTQWLLCYKCLAGWHSNWKRHGPGRLVLDNVWEPYGDCPWPASQVTDVICSWQIDRREWKGPDKSDFQPSSKAKSFSTRTSPYTPLSPATNPGFCWVLPWGRKPPSLHVLMLSQECQVSCLLFSRVLGTADCAQVMG